MKTSANLQKAWMGGGRGWDKITISKKGDNVKSCCHKETFAKAKINLKVMQPVC